MDVLQLTWSGSNLGASTTSTASMDYGVKAMNDSSVTGDRTINGAIFTCTATYNTQQTFTVNTTVNVNCKSISSSDRYVYILRNIWNTNYWLHYDHSALD
jgi:hypothetical protein